MVRSTPPILSPDVENEQIEKSMCEFRENVQNTYPPTPSGVNRRVGYVVNGNVWRTSDQTSGGGGATSHGWGVTSSRIAIIYIYSMKIENRRNWFEKKYIDFLSTGFDKEFSGGSF